MEKVIPVFEHDLHGITHVVEKRTDGRDSDACELELHVDALFALGALSRVSSMVIDEDDGLETIPLGVDGTNGDGEDASSVGRVENTRHLLPDGVGDVEGHVCNTGPGLAFTD